MNTYERLSVASDRHRVSLRDHSIQISAVDSTKEALERFQSIAIEAIENEGDGYEIYGRPHQTSRYSGGLYDMIILLKRTDDD